MLMEIIRIQPAKKFKFLSEIQNFSKHILQGYS